MDARFVSYMDQNCGTAAAGSSTAFFSSSRRGMSPAEVTGIAAGIVGALLALCVLIMFLMARKKKQEHKARMAAIAAANPPRPVEEMATGALPPKMVDEMLPAYLEKDERFPPIYENAEAKKEEV
jgi:hypothetical protein